MAEEDLLELKRKECEQFTQDLKEIIQKTKYLHESEISSTLILNGSLIALQCIGNKEHFKVFLDKCMKEVFEVYHYIQEEMEIPDEK